MKRELITEQARGLVRSIQGLAEVDIRWKGYVIFSINMAGQK